MPKRKLIDYKALLEMIESEVPQMYSDRNSLTAASSRG